MAKSNPFRFSTKYTDNESGLVNYGLRIYSPCTGRWLSRDPIEEAGGVNLYAIIGNNPLEYVDIYGLGRFVVSETHLTDEDRERLGVKAEEANDRGFQVRYFPDPGECENGKLVLYQIVEHAGTLNARPPHVDSDISASGQLPPAMSGSGIRGPGTYIDSPGGGAYGRWRITAVAVCRVRCNNKEIDIRLATKYFELNNSTRIIEDTRDPQNPNPADHEHYRDGMQNWVENGGRWY